MPLAELAHLELLAEVDALVQELGRWADEGPPWPPARHAAALVHRLAERTRTLRVRLDAPLIVATLGGTGTGKSTLVNALVGSDVSEAGRQRPTTRKPTLICRPDLTPELLGFDPGSVRVVVRDLPLLRDLVLVDCPDPDTTEDDEAPGTNLARLRDIVPRCDVLLVASTQQKYRSARVAQELAAAAPGARLVFVQTHADVDEDIREDWRRLLAEDYVTGEVFFVDSLAALADARAGVQPRGEFARLVDFLTRELAGAAATRIRRANFLDLVEETLAACRQRIDAGLPAVQRLEAALEKERARLADRMAGAMRDELLESHRPWEERLLGEIATRWGFSPFSALLRVYQGIGGLIAGASLWRVHTPAQLALWGAFEGGRRWRAHRERQRTSIATMRGIEGTWDAGELARAVTILDGYAHEAGLPRESGHLDAVSRRASDAAATFVIRASSDIQTLVSRLADRHSGWFTRFRYEVALLVVVLALLYRFGRNFFVDSWLAHELGWAAEPQPVLGVDFFVAAGFVLAIWCGLLLWAFTSRLRRGLRGEVHLLAERWTAPEIALGIFAPWEEQCRQIREFHCDLELPQARVAVLQRRVVQPIHRLGHRVTKTEPAEV